MKSFFAPECRNSTLFVITIVINKFDFLLSYIRDRNCEPEAKPRFTTQRVTKYFNYATRFTQHFTQKVCEYLRVTKSIYENPLYNKLSPAQNVSFATRDDSGIV